MMGFGIGAVLLLLLLWLGARSLRLPSPATQLQQALQAQAQRGDLAPLQALARSGWGDAHHALFQLHDAANQPALALASLQAALSAVRWIHRIPLEDEYDRRRFLGIGVVPDHGALLQAWGSSHFAGYNREMELAWIQTFGPAAHRDPRQAWYWLCLRKARWGDRAPAHLPSHSLAELVAQLEQQVPKAIRDRLTQEAERAAYSEFVEGK